MAKPCLYRYQTSAISFILIFTRGSEGRGLIKAFVYIWKKRNWSFSRAKAGRQKQEQQGKHIKAKYFFTIASYLVIFLY